MAGTCKIMAVTSTQLFSVSEVLSMLDLDDTQRFRISMICMTNPVPIYLTLTMIGVAMEEPPEEHVPFKKHMENNKPVCHSRRKKQKRHPEPIAREWYENP